MFAKRGQSNGDLQANWDGYNADPILPQALELAKGLVSYMGSTLPKEPRESMFVAPGRDGGVLIEWSDANYEQELGIEIDGSISMLHVNRADGTMNEEAFDSGRAEIRPVSATKPHAFWNGLFRDQLGGAFVSSGPERGRGV